MIHRGNHSLSDCKLFRTKSFDEKRHILKSNGVCFRCSNTKDHLVEDCTVVAKCSECGSSSHVDAMHMYRTRLFQTSFVYTPVKKGGDSNLHDSTSAVGHNVNHIHKPLKDLYVSSKCITLCGEGFHGCSCAKTVLVNIYPTGYPEKAMKVYAIQ